MFIHRLLDTPKNRLKAFAMGGLVVAQAVTGTTLAMHSGTSSSDAVVQIAGAEAGSHRQVSAQQLLTLAEGQVGISEDSAGGGTKFHSWYMSSPRARETVARDSGKITDYADAAWCDMFVSWVGTQLGLQDTVGTDAYTVAHAKWFASQGRWGTTPAPGAVVFFDWTGGKRIGDISHVGFVVKDNGDGTIQTVEGNTGNGRVEIRTRPTAQVAGYGYPSYAA
ncbi:CHAP domain-containing protein [Sphaerisporangium corydalis]|uniref:CHAP domain-containing protein n=1 Tax=Sphaerisporangium corydalis TaxID=1441875 RepID=A0ABV9E8Q5_9ACTN|nr:CHAP domain-containing protein [Sphaerisporangium corydalis]